MRGNTKGRGRSGNRQLRSIEAAHETGDLGGAGKRQRLLAARHQAERHAGLADQPLPDGRGHAGGGHRAIPREVVVEEARDCD